VYEETIELTGWVLTASCGIPDQRHFQIRVAGGGGFVSTTFWIKRFLTVFVGAFVIISAVQILKGRDVSYSVIEGAIWGFVTAAVFTAARFFQSRRGQHCAICKDTPEVQTDPSRQDGGG
jgi:hypothetical protein